MGVKLENFIDEKDVLYYVQAMKELLKQKVIGKIETRPELDTFFIELERKIQGNPCLLYKKVKKEYNLDLKITEASISYSEENSKPTTNSPIIIEQKQKGYYQSSFILKMDTLKQRTYISL